MHTIVLEEPLSTKTLNGSHARCPDKGGVSARVRLKPADALVLVDVQNDFLAGGALPVPDSGHVVHAANRYLSLFETHHLPVFATCDWHPLNHCSFLEQGGCWPPHCIAGTVGAEFPATLRLPKDACILKKGTRPEQEAYSAFQGTSLDTLLRASGVTRLFIGGLATDYCVLNSVKEALVIGYAVLLLGDAIAGVNVHPGNSDSAIDHMCQWGARLVAIGDIQE